MRALAFTLAVLCAAALSLLAYVALSSRHRKSSRAPVRLLGRAGSVVRELAPEGFVLIEGELWPARLRGGGGLSRGRVRVVGASGCALEVEPAADGPEAGS